MNNKKDKSHVLLTKPNGRDRRLEVPLLLLLELVLRLAHAGLVLLGELLVCPSLLRCLSLS